MVTSLDLGIDKLGTGTVIIRYIGNQDTKSGDKIPAPGRHH